MYKRGVYLAIVLALGCGGGEASEKPGPRFVVGRDGEGTVTDTWTDVVWAATDNQQNTSFEEAGRFCQQRKMKLPSLRRLQALYQAGRTSHAVSCSLGGASVWHPEELSLSCGWYFSEDAGRCSAFDFSTGEVRECALVNQARALCVQKEAAKPTTPFQLPQQADTSLPISESYEGLSSIPVVGISSRHLMFKGVALAEVALLQREFENPTPGANPYLIKALAQRIEAYRDQLIVERGFFDRRVLIQADQEIRFAVLWRVLYSLMSAGFDEISLAVSAPGRTAVGQLRVAPLAEVIGDLRIAIELKEDRLVLSNGPIEKVGIPKKDTYDFERLFRELKSIKEANPKKEDVAVGGFIGSYQEIIEVINTCLRAGFSEVSLVAVEDLKLVTPRWSFAPVSGSPAGSPGSFGESSGGPVELVDGRADVKGSLDREIIRRVLRRAKNQIMFCYEQSSRVSRPLPEKGKIFFVIGPNGAVRSAEPKGGDLPTEIAECIARKISQLSFPAPQGGGIVEVTYPFTFQSSQDR